MLVRPLTLPLIEAALASLNQTSSPGVDGIPCTVYSKFQCLFAPRMLSITMHTLDSGTLNPEWAEALLNLIPKGRGVVQVADCHPLVLQNTAHKWMAAMVELQTQDLVTAITPPSPKQKGFVKGRSIFDYLWHCFGDWQTVNKGIFCPVDFRKAFNSITRDYTRAFLQLLCLPDSMVTLILNLFQAPILLLIQGQVCKDKCFHPRAGV